MPPMVFRRSTEMEVLAVREPALQNPSDRPDRSARQGEAQVLHMDRSRGVREAPQDPRQAPCSIRRTRSLRATTFSMQSRLAVSLFSISPEVWAEEAEVQRSQTNSVVERATPLAARGADREAQAGSCGSPRANS